MAKKKKKRKLAARPNDAGSAGDGPLNAPFAGLKKALGKVAAQSAPPAAPPARDQPPADEGDMFAQAMSGVQRLDPKDRRVKPRGGRARPPRLDAAVDEDLEVMAHLAELVGGSGEFDLRYSDQYVSGAAEGVGPELMKRLAQGGFPIQDYLDLHGLGREEALGEVERFLVSCATRGLRHVLVVHGKGSRSPLGVPVLKNALARALTGKRLAKRVLAFCSARSQDGGVGAMYVLLRKWSGPGRPRW
jgi:DNA-nicking Smr family endonuclease